MNDVISNFSVECHPNTSNACCVSSRGGIFLVQLENAEWENAAPSSSRFQPSAVAFSSDGDTLAISSFTGHILVKLSFNKH